MIGFIDPPGRYSPKKQWEEFLERMQSLPQDDPQVQAALEAALRAGHIGLAQDGEVRSNDRRKPLA